MAPPDAGDAVAQPAEAVDEAEGDEAAAPAGEHVALVAGVRDEAPGVGEGDHCHDVGGEFAFSRELARGGSQMAATRWLLTLLYRRGLRARFCGQSRTCD